MAVTLERLSLAEGIVLARTWSPTVSRQLELAAVAAACPVLLPSSGGGTELPSVAVVMVVVASLVGSTGTMTNPKGRSGMQDGSSPLMASWMASTSMVE